MQCMCSLEYSFKYWDVPQLIQNWVIFRCASISWIEVASEWVSDFFQIFGKRLAHLRTLLGIFFKILIDRLKFCNMNQIWVLTRSCRRKYLHPYHPDIELVLFRMNQHQQQNQQGESGPGPGLQMAKAEQYPMAYSETIRNQLDTDLTHIIHFMYKDNRTKKPHPNLIQRGSCGHWTSWSEKAYSIRLRRWYCENVILWECVNVWMWYCDIVRMWECENVVLWYCDHLVGENIPNQVEEVRMWYCENVILWYCENVILWYCDHLVGENILNQVEEETRGVAHLW